MILFFILKLFAELAASLELSDNNIPIFFITFIFKLSDNSASDA